MTMVTAKNTSCLWFDMDAEQAARFYAATLPNSEVRAVRAVRGAIAAFVNRAMRRP